MVKDLLDLHLVETSRQRLLMEDIRLSSLTDWLEDRFEPMAAGKGVTLRLETPEPDDDRVRCDRRMLQLILQNLVDNAVKFTAAGGRRLRLQRADGHLLVIVRDTGCGIPPEIQARVFERFFQADPSRTGDSRVRGTGLGLAIVKHAAEHGATVNLQSEVGKGTSVEVRLPAQSGTTT